MGPRFQTSFTSDLAPPTLSMPYFLVAIEYEVHWLVLSEETVNHAHIPIGCDAPANQVRGVDLIGRPRPPSASALDNKKPSRIHSLTPSAKSASRA